MEGVLAKLYDVLGRLGYPEITKIDVKDLAANVLSGQNRITLLSWLLSRSSATLSSHLEKLQGTSLKGLYILIDVQINHCIHLLMYQLQKKLLSVIFKWEFRMMKICYW